MSTPSSRRTVGALLQQIESEQESLVARLADIQSQWLPVGMYYPENNRGLPIPRNSATSRLHDDGTGRTFLPFRLNDERMLERILADSEEVAKWQAGVCAFTRSITPLLDTVDKEFSRISSENEGKGMLNVPQNIYHVGLAYRAIKWELSEALRKFADCRNEFLVGLRNNEARTTAKEALRYIFVKIEDWYGRLELLSRFCRFEEDAQFADLLAPNSAVTIDSLGIRITQWEESGAFMVKLQNIGNNRVKLSEALFTMPESDARRDTTEAVEEPPEDIESSRKWVDVVKINRVLTPYPTRVENLRRKAKDKGEFIEPEPSFICFSFARNTPDNDKGNDKEKEKTAAPGPGGPRGPESEGDENIDENVPGNAQKKTPGAQGEKKPDTGKEATKKAPGKSGMSTSFKLKLVE